MHVSRLRVLYGIYYIVLAVDCVTSLYSFPLQHCSHDTTRLSLYHLYIHVCIPSLSVPVLWVIAAGLLAKFTNFFQIILSDGRVLKVVLYPAVVCLGINTVLLLYLTVYLPKLKSIKDSTAWDVYCPRVVPTMTGLGVLSALLLIRATWPVWGFLAPLILGVEFLGGLFLLHFVPWF